MADQTPGNLAKCLLRPLGSGEPIGADTEGRNVQKPKANAMRPETIAVHGGYDPEAVHRAVAVPIYQTVAYAFDSADHGAALFNLEVEGHRYGRISNPTTSVLEKRVAELEGGVGALCVGSGQAALNYAVLNLTDMG